MNQLSEIAIIDKIKQRQTFSAAIEGGAFSLSIDKYEPALSAAIHNGGNMRQELVENCCLSQAERYYEEDPYTGTFIEQQPITIIGHDSRYEYDLNRATKQCVYETAWGKDVWKTPLSPEIIGISKAKHAQFYRIISAVVEALIEDFGQCIVYDIHSYNYKRHERTDLPVFNLGTSTVRDKSQWPVITAWLEALQNIKVDGVDVTAAENDIFYGKGFLAEYCHTNYDTVLVLATEVKKVFMDELTGEPDKVVLPSMQQEFNRLITANTVKYMQGIGAKAN